MTPLDPSASDPTDERLSRALDQDLAPEEQADLDAALAEDPQLQERLAALDHARAWLSEPVEQPDDDTFDRLLDRALEMFHVEHSDPTTLEATEPVDSVNPVNPVDAVDRVLTSTSTATVTALRPRRQGSRFTPLRGLSIAAALLAVVAAAALFARSTSGRASDSQTLAEATQATAPAAGAVADAAAPASDRTATKAAASEALSDPATTTAPGADAGSATIRPADQVAPSNHAFPGTVPADASPTTAAAAKSGSIPPPADPNTVRSFATVDDLLADIASSAANPITGTASTTAPSTASSAAFATAAVGTLDVQCGADLPYQALIGDRPVRWGTRPGPTATGVHLVVVDVGNCVVLADTSR